MIDTLRLTAEEAKRLLEAGEISGAELFAAYRAAIDDRDEELHCYLHLCDDPGGDGLPIALKDVIGTKGIPTTAGSRILEGYVPVYDSTVVERLKAHGLRILGKTNTDEFAMGSSTENSAYGPSRNPWDPSRVPGGSGGGSAAAVSAGLAPWALGSDTGGSIKQPSALCGNVGLRPTYGTVSRYGIVAFASSLDQVGPVARTVRDCAFLYSIIAGRDERDSTTVELPQRVELPQAEDLQWAPDRRADGAERGGGDRARRRGRGAGCDREARGARRRGRGVLAAALGRVRDGLLLPDRAGRGLLEPRPLRRRPLRLSRRQRANVCEMYERTRDEGFGDEPKRRIMVGTYALSAGYYDAYYGQAQKVRTVIKREHDALFETFDALVSPTSPTVAFPLGARTADPIAMYLSDLLTIPSCMAGLPGLNVPCGLSEGLPVGLQLIGPQFAENTLFRIGHALEQAIGFDPVPERLR